MNPLSPRAGDAAILKQNEPRIARLVRSFRSTGIPLEDLQQEARIAALRAIRAWSPDGGASLATLVYQSVLHHLCKIRRGLHLARRRAAAVHSLDASVPGTDRTWLDTMGEPASQVEELDRADFHRMIGRLPERHQRVVEGYLEERTVRDIAKEVGVSKSRVDQIYQDAVALLSRMARTPIRRTAAVDAEVHP